MPAISFVIHMVATITSAGMTVLTMPRPMPPMITVAWPVSDCAANDRVNLNSYEV